MPTALPRGPRSRRTASSLLIPMAFSPSIRAMTSPRRIPRRYAGDPSKMLLTVMPPSMTLIWIPSP